MKRVLTGTILVLATVLPALAERAPHRFEANLGVFAPQLDTNIRLDGSGGLVGVELDFEENFNLSKTEVVPVLLFDWWISKKHGLNLTYFDLSRSSSGESTISFRFGNQVFPANVPLDVRFDTNVVALTYSYKFFHDERRSFGLNVGFNVNGIDTGIRATTTGGPEIQESASATAPLPVLGVNGHVMLSKKWKFYGTIGIFGLSYDHYDGSLSSISAGFIHHTFRNVGFGVGLYGFNVDIDSENEDFLGKITYGYNGVIAYINLRFR